MIRFRFNDRKLNVLISKKEKIDFRNVKSLIKKGSRMVQQNGANAVIIEIDSKNVDKKAFELFSRIILCSNSFPIAIISSF